MPTNILRKASDSVRKPAARADHGAAAPRVALLKAGRASVRVQLVDSATADLVWAALPLHGTAETWGASVHFETPLEAGRDRSARLLGTAGDVYFWISDDRIIVPFGPTPISRPNECRLPSLCNVIGRALDDAKVLAAVRPGERLNLTALEERRAGS